MAPTKRVAFVTGAAGDLGSAIAVRLAADGLDIAVAELPARKEALEKVVAEIKEKGVRVIAVYGDVSVEADVNAMVNTTVEELGGLDVMVANVGIFIVKPLLALEVDEWDRVVNTNLRGAFLCYKAAATQMIKQGRGGRIIGGGSTAGLTGAPLCGPYCASKFGVRGLTQVAAAELGSHNITVNAYAPGFIEGTKMVGAFEEGATKVMGLPDGAWMQVALGLFKMGRLGKRSEVAGLVSYLASEDAAWTTGQFYAVDGGMVLS